MMVYHEHACSRPCLSEKTHHEIQWVGNWVGNHSGKGNADPGLGQVFSDSDLIRLFRRLKGVPSKCVHG